MVFPKVCTTSSINSGNPITSTTLSPVHLISLPAILVGIIALVVITPLQAHPLIPVVNSRHFEYKRYCSNSLAEAMRLICGGRSNSYTSNLQYQDSSATVNSSNLKHYTDDDGVFFRTGQAGQIHECCLRPCGYSELKMYCAPA